MEKIRITKQEMKKNDLAELLSKLRLLFEKNKDRMKPIAIGVFVSILLIVGIMAVIKNKKSNANEIYSSGQEKYSQNIFNAGSNFDQSIAEFEKAYNTYSSSNQSKITLLNIADAYYRKNDYDKALINYEKFLKANSDDRFEVLGLFGKAMTLSQQKKYDESLQILENLLKNEDADFIKADIIVQSALIYNNNGKTEKAVETLNLIISDEHYKNSNWKIYADYLALYIKQKQYFPNVEYDLSKISETGSLPQMQNSVFSADLNKNADTNASVTIKKSGQN